MAKKQKIGKTPKLSRSARNKSKGKYARRFAITDKNRIKRQLSHMARHPQDLQAKQRYDSLVSLIG